MSVWTKRGPAPNTTWNVRPPPSGEQLWREPMLLVQQEAGFHLLVSGVVVGSLPAQLENGFVFLTGGSLLIGRYPNNFVLVG